MKDVSRGMLGYELDEEILELNIQADNVQKNHSDALVHSRWAEAERCHETMVEIRTEQSILGSLRASLLTYKAHDRMITPVTWVQCEFLLYSKLLDAKDHEVVRKFLGSILQ